MEANELMIGDIVTFKDCQHDENPTIVKIWQINQDGEAFVFIDNEQSTDEIIIDDEIVGLPLTPEILEKNGFLTPDNDIYIWEKGINKVRLYTDDNHTWFIDLRSDKCDDIDCLAINSVHELQHALRLCKIDKEIVL